jgi:hypothetical protein
LSAGEPPSARTRLTPPFPLQFARAADEIGRALASIHEGGPDAAVPVARPARPARRVAEARAADESERFRVSKRARVLTCPFEAGSCADVSFRSGLVC